MGDFETVERALNAGWGEHSRAMGDGPSSGHACSTCNTLRAKPALDRIEARLATAERKVEALARVLEPEAIDVSGEDDWGPEQVLLLLSGSKSERRLAVSVLLALSTHDQDPE